MQMQIISDKNKHVARRSVTCLIALSNGFAFQPFLPSQKQREAVRTADFRETSSCALAILLALDASRKLHHSVCSI